MKTTLDIPDAIFRRAKARAAERKVPLRRLVSDALAEKLEGESPARQKARTKLAGRLRHLRKELVVLIAHCDSNTEDTRCPLIDRPIRQGGRAAI